MRAFTHPGVGAGRCDGQADVLHHAQVGQVVAHERDLVHADVQPGGERPHAGQLVGHRGVRLQPELGRALLGDHARARGDEYRGDARLAQQHQAEAVVDVERLEFAAVAVEQQAAVGQRAVDVEARQPHARGALADVGGVIVEVRIGHGGWGRGKGEGGRGNQSVNDKGGKAGQIFRSTIYPSPFAALKPLLRATGHEY